jgi:hypothetical protein
MYRIGCPSNISYVWVYIAENCNRKQIIVDAIFPEMAEPARL